MKAKSQELPDGGFWARKAFHTGNSIFLAIFVLLISPSWLIPLAAAAMISVLVFEYIRLKTAARSDIHGSMGRMLKKEERKRISGLFYTALAPFLLVWLVDPVALSYAFLMLAFVDPLASIMGKTFKSKKIYRNKSFVGTGTAIVIGVILSIFFLSLIGGVPFYKWYWGVIFGLTAGIFETFGYPIDDNFSILFTSGILMHLLLL